MHDALALPPQTGWMPVLYQMVDSGDQAAMHPSSAAVYLVIKRHADVHSGLSSVSNRILMKESGISKPTMYKARDSLKRGGPGKSDRILSYSPA
ncbi:MAG TPA: helix-turn-helix domain-containing protein [Magnetospirillum sp.]|nr:helix-turn-helix domain-containing protein [Magnetospirillum sp.]